MTKMPTYEELLQTLSYCVDDLSAWAASGPEGFTPSERKRFLGYERVLQRAAQAREHALGSAPTQAREGDK